MDLSTVKREIPISTLIPERFQTDAPTEADALLARESSRRLASRTDGSRTSLRIQLLDDGADGEAVEVPASALRLFLNLLTEMSQGNAVTLIPTHAELTDRVWGLSEWLTYPVKPVQRK